MVYDMLESLDHVKNVNKLWIKNVQQDFWYSSLSKSTLRKNNYLWIDKVAAVPSLKKPEIHNMMFKTAGIHV